MDWAVDTLEFKKASILWANVSFLPCLSIREDISHVCEYVNLGSEESAYMLSILVDKNGAIIYSHITIIYKGERAQGESYFVYPKPVALAS